VLAFHPLNCHNPSLHTDQRLPTKVSRGWGVADHNKNTATIHLK